MDKSRGLKCASKYFFESGLVFVGDVGRRNRDTDDHEFDESFNLHCLVYSMNTVCIIVQSQLIVRMCSPMTEISSYHSYLYS